MVLLESVLHDSCDDIGGTLSFSEHRLRVAAEFRRRRDSSLRMGRELNRCRHRLEALPVDVHEASGGQRLVVGHNRVRLQDRGPPHAAFVESLLPEGERLLADGVVEDTNEHDAVCRRSRAVASAVLGEVRTVEGFEQAMEVSIGFDAEQPEPVVVPGR